MLEEDKKLVEEAKQDPSKFGALYEKYFDQIYRYVFRRVSDKDAVYDIVSQTFYDALTHMKSYEWRGVSYGAWLYKIAHNNVLKWFREQSKLKTVMLDDGKNSIDKSVNQLKDMVDKERKDQMAVILDQLEPQDREIIKLKFFEEVSNIEIADIMGTNANHIGVKIYRALKKVKQLIAK